MDNFSHSSPSNDQLNNLNLFVPNSLNLGYENNSFVIKKAA